MSQRRHSTISRTYGANSLAESKGLIASGLIAIKLELLKGTGGLGLLGWRSKRKVRVL
jgi:hypothetical protein